MLAYDSHYYGGAWQASRGAGVIDVLSSATEAVVGRVPRGTPDDVDQAVRAARAAFETWSQVPPEQRANWLDKLAAALKPRVPQIAELISHEVGTALSYSTKVQVEFPVTMIGMNARFIRSAALEEELGTSLVVKEPVGVVGCITPWNYPLHQVVCKIAPALAAGCTVVLKPAELAPLSAGMLAEAAHEIGLPAGVLNIVFGEGKVVGEAIVAHRGVDMVSFTGSLAAGRRVAAVAGDGIKRVCLELGGKSAFVVLDDAPFEKAIPAGVNNCMQNSGQTCSAWTRMLVPRARHDEAVELAKTQLAKLTLGDPFDGATRLGPLASAAQRDRVLGYIDRGKSEGAALAAGGGRPSNLPNGYYVEPTIFANVEPGMTIAQEEIFGPVLSVLPYDGEDDAVRIANDSIYGLAGGVWSATKERALDVARRLRTGQVDINGARFNALAPFGGYKQSGVGREIGPHALDEFFQLKAIQQ
ncbi:MAG TPA: aldehyde dehydrogenase family protein [Vicinamibacterales bacterium]|jgi:acyl-CoA reductase-like NAD-dependent aldehyde dehydrogenase|nr:aldehyde dehydrogenase family protein [Vicinamibacterales bacterium]